MRAEIAVAVAVCSTSCNRGQSIEVDWPLPQVIDWQTTPISADEVLTDVVHHDTIPPTSETPWSAVIGAGGAVWRVRDPISILPLWPSATQVTGAANTTPLRAVTAEHGRLWAVGDQGTVLTTDIDDRITGSVAGADDLVAVAAVGESAIAVDSTGRLVGIGDAPVPALSVAISDIASDDAGRYWAVATDGGVWRWTNATDAVEIEIGTRGGEHVAVGPAREIGVYNASGFLATSRDGELFEPGPMAPSSSVKDAAWTGDDAWILDDIGLWQLQQGQWVIVKEDPSLTRFALAPMDVPELRQVWAIDTAGQLHIRGPVSAVE